MGQFELTPSLVQSVLKTVDAGLSSGLGKPIPGHMCVEAAVCYALGFPHGDNPSCVDFAIQTMKIRLNDAQWSSKAARAKGMRRLAVLQLGTKDCGFDRHEFAKKLALMTINTILPIALTAVGLQDHAAKCQAAYAADAAAYAASAARAARAAERAAYSAYAASAVAYAANAAAYAAYSAHAASAAYAASYAANAAAYAADATARDIVLGKFAKIAEDILIEMGVPAVKFLHLIK